MTTQEFIDSYKLNKDLVKHIKQDYIPYLEKVTRCEKIITVTSYNEITHLYHRNTPVQTLFLTLTLIDLYTDIDIDFENPASEYDILEKDGYIEKIMSCVPGRELSQFQAIFTMVNDDLAINERSLVSFFENKLDTINQILSETK